MPTRYATYSVFTMLSLCLVFTSGCGSGTGSVEGRSKVHPVEGTVNYKGQPVEGAVVVFHSETDQISASGLTDPQGMFKLQTYDANDGAVSGPHKITVTKVELKTVPNPEDENLGPISSEEVWHTPRKYSTLESSPLSQVVSDSEPNSFQIVLED